MVFLAEDTNGMVIHLNGFDDKRHADNFVKKLMKNWNSRSTNIKAVVVAAIVIVVISIIF